MHPNTDDERRKFYSSQNLMQEHSKLTGMMTSEPTMMKIATGLSIWILQMKFLKDLDGRAVMDLEMRKRVRMVRTSSTRSSNRRLRRGGFGMTSAASYRSCVSACLYGWLHSSC
jgi:hypothetical protein